MSILVVEFEVANQRFALPAQSVREILRLVATTPLPNSSPHVRGAMNLRGVPVTVADLRSLLGAPVEDRGDTPILVLDQPGNPLGVIADRIFQVESVPKEDIRDREPGDPSPEFVQGLLVRGRQLVCVVDPDRLAAAFRESSS